MIATILFAFLWFAFGAGVSSMVLRRRLTAIDRERARFTKLYFSLLFQNNEKAPKRGRNGRFVPKHSESHGSE